MEFLIINGSSFIGEFLFLYV